MIVGNRSKLLTDSPNPSRTPSRTPARTPRFSESDDYYDRPKNKKTVPPSPSRSTAKSPRRDTSYTKEKQCPIKGCDSQGMWTTKVNIL